MRNPLLNSFRNLFKISKLECVNNIFFSNAIYKLFRDNCPWQKYVVICHFWEEFHGIQLSRASFLKRNYSGKNVLGAKVQGEIALEGISCEVIFQGGAIQG